MKKLMVVVFTVMCLIGLLDASAFAQNVKIEYVDLFGWGRSYDAVGNPTNINPYFSAHPQGGDNGVGQSLPIGVVQPGDNKEDSFTIAQVARITSADGLISYWDKATSGQELTAFGYGFDDTYLSAVNPVTNQNTLGAVGGRIELWLDTTPDYNPNLGTAGRSNPVDPTFYQGVTDDGILVLNMPAHLVITAFNPAGFTLVETANFDHLSFNGSMQMDVDDVNGGAWGAFFNTNSQLDGSDFSYSWSSSGNFPSPPGPGIADWLVFDDSTAYGTQGKVPEPITLVLYGVGFAGAGLYRRMRRP